MTSTLVRPGIDTGIDTGIDIVLSAPVNLRDLGGIPVGDGSVRPGLAIRADDLSTITADAAAELVANGLAAVIDLRTPLEVALTGRGPLAGHAVAYHHLPLLASVADGMPKEAQSFTPEAMGQMYLAMVERAAPQLVTALGIIAFTPGSTAFHCAAGRDRTGVLAALLLLILGADDEDIVADYASTGPNMPAIMERTRPVMGAMMARLGIDFNGASAASLTEQPMHPSMRVLLAGLRERHGDPLAPLRAAGLGDDTVARLRSRALGA
ncbi:tyrosine-protein phosphatase [Microterricola pindariensis]|uniref:Transcriptional regulator n=1 Tax=Microterricola pindariensis TaxID=478010 RepID=A0ABX5ARA0_9MICO|nr:tyrosine-protein phosphatase [Microterricola pindariensis]PPL14431.1 transcriptional regulator [Microterricola pindariensis]